MLGFLVYIWLQVSGKITGDSQAGERCGLWMVLAECPACPPVGSTEAAACLPKHTCVPRRGCVFLFSGNLIFTKLAPPPPRKASFVKQGLPLVQELSFLFFKWVGVGDIAVLDT